jgi:hypothetical protein
MQTIILTVTIASILALSFFMAFAIKLYLSKIPDDRKWANDWLHRMGFIARILVAAVPVITGIYYNLPFHTIFWQFLLVFLISWAGWDLCINFINGWKWHYSGSTISNTSSRIDKLLNRYDEFIKAFLLLIITFYPGIIDTIQNRLLDLIISIVLIAATFYGIWRMGRKKAR